MKALPSGWSCFAVVCVLLGVAGAVRGQEDGEPSALVPVAVPAAPGALAPSLRAGAQGAWLSWLEPRGKGHALRVARYRDGAFAAPVTVVESETMFANWADVPSVVEGAEGGLLAHWLSRVEGGSYAYHAQLAASVDGGVTWQRLGTLHQDDTAAQHGFVSLLPEESGFRAVWLDGRDGGMSLRTAWVDVERGAVAASEAVLDDDVCSCCPTGLARCADGGSLAVYRDHASGEIRDVSFVHAAGPGEAWSKPAPVAADGWKMPACPVNGPAVASADGLTAVAWYTEADDRPRVQLALARSLDEGFGAPILVDGDRPIGRVSTLRLAEGAVVCWLARSGGGAALRVRYFDESRLQRQPVTLAALSSGRHTGVPSITRVGDELLVVWREAFGKTADARLQGVRIALPELARR